MGHLDAHIKAKFNTLLLYMRYVCEGVPVQGPIFFLIGCIEAKALSRVY